MFRAVLVGTFLAMLAMSVLSATLAIRGSAVAETELVRTRLAHQVLEAHLRLETLTLVKVKQLTDALLSGTVDVEARNEAGRRLREQIELTRMLIAREVALVQDEDEASELQHLAQIERLIAGVLTRLDRSIEAMKAGAPPSALAEVAEVLDRTLDGEFRRLMDEALEEELEEVAEAEETAREALARVSLLSKVAAALAALLCIAALGILVPRLGRSLRGLETAAKGVAAGDLSLRLDPGRRDEFGMVARNVNCMLDELQRRRDAIDAARAALETTVEDRTRALASANANLKRSDDMRRRFLADISHELRTPLTIIRGEAEVTLRSRHTTEEELRTALARIAEQATSTARLVDDLLFVARTDAGEPKVARQTVALPEVVRRATADMERLARERGVEIEFDSAISNGVGVVQGDPGRLRQLVLILVDNAVRYSNRGGTVSVSIAPSPQGVALRVADQGIGIPSGDLALVFDRFFRGNNAAERHGEGSGLGLPMARSIAEAHGGSISLQSREGDGTIVTVILPQADRMRVVA